MKNIAKMNPVVIGKRINFLIALSALTLIAGGGVAFLQINEYFRLEAGIQQAKLNLESLKLEEAEQRDKYSELKSNFRGTALNTNNDLAKILPKSEEYTKLLFELSEHITKEQEKGKSIFASDIKFDKPNITDKSEFGVLPITLSVQGTEDEIMDLLTYFEHSGNTSSYNRLLDVQNINWSFIKEEEAEKITATIQVNAYFQLPEKK